MAQTYFNLILFLEKATVDDAGETDWQDTDFVTMIGTHLQPDEVIERLRHTSGILPDDLESAEYTLKIWATDHDASEIPDDAHPDDYEEWDDKPAPREPMRPGHLAIFMASAPKE